MAYINGNEVLFSPQIVGNFGGGIGEKTDCNGEIFNDYENNIAGTKGYGIIAWDSTKSTYTLSSSNGLDTLAPNTQYSIIWGNHYINAGEIVSVEGSVVTVTTDYNLNGENYDSLIIRGSGDAKYLYIVTRPDLGDVALDAYQHAEGAATKAALLGAHAEGEITKAIGRYSHAEGSETEAHHCAHAEGKGTLARGHYSHAEGYNTQTSGRWSHAEGSNTLASGEASHTEGNRTKATKNCAHAEGVDTTASGVSSHAEGESSTADAYNAHAEGKLTIAKGNASHAEGLKTRAMAGNAHSEGQWTYAGNTAAHAEGLGDENALEGTMGALGQASHVEGYCTTATGSYAHAEGNRTRAEGNSSHAGGQGTKARQAAQYVIGKYNNNKSDTLFEVGNGTSDTARSNAFEVKTNGTVVIGGIELSPAKIQALLDLIA